MWYWMTGVVVWLVGIGVVYYAYARWGNIEDSDWRVISFIKAILWPVMPALTVLWISFDWYTHHVSWLLAKLEAHALTHRKPRG
jgi:hypothetical protein